MRFVAPSIIGSALLVLAVAGTTHFISAANAEPRSSTTTAYTPLTGTSQAGPTTIAPASAPQLLDDIKQLVSLDQSMAPEYAETLARYSSPEFIAQQKANPDSDQLLCAQNFGPATFNTSIDGNTVALTVVQHFDSGTSQSVITADVQTGKIVGSVCS